MHQGRIVAQIGLRFRGGREAARLFALLDTGRVARGIGDRAACQRAGQATVRQRSFGIVFDCHLISAQGFARLGVGQEGIAERDLNAIRLQR